MAGESAMTGAQTPGVFWNAEFGHQLIAGDHFSTTFRHIWCSSAVTSSSFSPGRGSTCSKHLHTSTVRRTCVKIETVFVGFFAPVRALGNMTLSIGISHPLNEKRCRLRYLHSALFGNRFTKTATSNGGGVAGFGAIAVLGTVMVRPGWVRHSFYPSRRYIYRKPGWLGFRGEQRLLCKSRAAAHQTPHM